MNGISVLLKEPRRAPQPLLPCEATRGSLRSGKEPSPHHAGTLILGLQPPEL